MLCLGQNSKNEINTLIKSLNSKLVSKGSSTEQKFAFSVSKDGLLQIERILNAPKIAQRIFTYSLYIKDTDFHLDSQPRDSTTYYAFVFKDKMVKKNIKQVIKVKNYNTSLPEKVETESFVTLIIPLTLDVNVDDIKESSDAISKIFELAISESSYWSSEKE